MNVFGITRQNQQNSESEVFFKQIDIGKNPFEVFAKLSENFTNLYILESAIGPEKLAEYSFIGFDPRLKIKLINNQIQINQKKNISKFEISDNKFIFQELKNILIENSTTNNFNRLVGGLVGFISYDIVRYWENIAEKYTSMKFPDFEFGLYDEGIIFDHKNHKTHYYYTEKNRISDIKKILKNDHNDDSISFTNPESNISKEAFEKMISLGSNKIPTIFPETSFGIRKTHKENWISGFIRSNGKDFYNSVKYNNQIYDKRKLVPFGEFIPFHTLLNKMGLKFFLPFESFRVGKTNNNFDNFIVPLICYEGIFSYIVRENIQSTSGLMVNITNDVWFGTGAGPIQHFTHVRFRTVEYGLPLIRSANMGISALINPIGQIDEVISYGVLDFVDVKIPKKINQTLYAKFGDNIAYFFIVLFFRSQFQLKKYS